MTKPFIYMDICETCTFVLYKSRFISMVFAVSNLKHFFFSLKKVGTKSTIISAGRCEIPLIQNLCSTQSGGSFFSGGMESFLLLRALQIVYIPRNEKSTAMTEK